MHLVATLPPVHQKCMNLLLPSPYFFAPYSEFIARCWALSSPIRRSHLKASREVTPPGRQSEWCECPKMEGEKDQYLSDLRWTRACSCSACACQVWTVWRPPRCQAAGGGRIPGCDIHSLYTYKTTIHCAKQSQLPVCVPRRLMSTHGKDRLV